ncbi:MAG TPA: hypothetical protein VG796_16365 [Verrucomicrobiales bacterium]|nr:hypothetical protein [Verrucomicrobiales bacterium]
MKQSTFILSVSLALASGSAAWLLIENARLRSEASHIPPETQGRNSLPKVVAGPVSQPTAGGGRNTTSGRTPDKNSKRSGADKALPSATAGAFNVVDNGDGTFTVSDAAGSWQQVMNPEQWREFRQKVEMAMTAATTKRPGGPSWSPGRAAGPPDTPNHGDHATAWASQAPDGGKEWLQLKYSKSVEISEINILESYNPGALSKVSAIMPDGSEKIIWEGRENPEEGVVERAVKVPKGIRSDQIRIELDTSRVPGWNEIDAVELVGTDGSRQWAAESTASSYYGQNRGLLTAEGTGILLLDDGLEAEATTLTLKR